MSKALTPIYTNSPNNDILKFIEEVITSSDLGSIKADIVLGAVRSWLKSHSEYEQIEDEIGKLQATEQELSEDIERLQSKIAKLKNAMSTINALSGAYE